MECAELVGARNAKAAPGPASPCPPDVCPQATKPSESYALWTSHFAHASRKAPLPAQ